MRRVLAALALVALAAAAALAGCGAGTGHGPVVPNGDAARGKRLIVHFGCGGCHTIGGVPGADARVGPRLPGFAGQHVIAGRLANTPANLVRWIMEPQQVDPGNDMPDLGVSRAQARDIAAYIYSQ